MTEGQITLDLSQVLIAVIGLVGGYVTSRFLNKNAQETSASSILDTVWTKLGDLEGRVSILEGKVTRRDLLLTLSRGHILGMEENWPEAHREDLPKPHPELSPFLETGLVEPESASTNTASVKVDIPVNASAS